MMTLTLPIPPSTNALFATVRTRTGGTRRVTSLAYSRWQWAAFVAIRDANPVRVVGPYAVSIAIPHTSRMDADNACKAVLDALVKHGVTEDDRRCVRVVAEKRADVPAGLCRVSVDPA